MQSHHFSKLFSHILYYMVKQDGQCYTAAHRYRPFVATHWIPEARSSHCTGSTHRLFVETVETQHHLVGRPIGACRKIHIRSFVLITCKYERLRVTWCMRSRALVTIFGKVMDDVHCSLEAFLVIYHSLCHGGNRHDTLTR